MVRGSQEVSPQGLTRELRQFTGLAASFFRAAAARLGMTVTDLQVLDILESSNSSTAGQLADLTGLTTGAITGMLNRLEEAGLVRRERDPQDGRKVIVKLVEDKDEKQKIGPMFASLGKAWEELVADYDEEQIAFLQEFLKRNNELTRREIISLQEAPAHEGEVYSAPLEDISRAQLVIVAGLSELSLHARPKMAELYQARFEGPVPKVTSKDGMVTIRYPRRLLGLGKLQGTAEVSLNTTIPWQMSIQVAASEFNADLRDLVLSELEIKGSFNALRVELPAPSDVVPIQLTGAATEITVRRPAGTALRVHLKGWATSFVLDDQIFNNIGKNSRMLSSGFVPTAPYYDIEITGSSSNFVFTAV
ncbi:MarR family transcriptional regulator [Ktedonosporobacter rubrisoli]|uniref:MarR family transcriptional regulator n=1 Tax=Ktedonosporobacter rubrisoli TaxID=2509675 RepID=A0A4P6JYG2_KTERU|nr:MarR family transcriptional regulator [Ktedonosporobacter rubrisoli]QBD80848.1 MarR family transcriptional regulator [Ktedonosporobacter rubrisoli]